MPVTTSDLQLNRHRMSSPTKRLNKWSSDPQLIFKKIKTNGNISAGISGRQQTRLQEQRHLLPISPVRQRLLSEISRRSSSIVIGETGCGKTTQLPQFLLEAGMNKKRIIACTQPRRVAAITVAQRVAQERATHLGEEVGYCVRFDDMTSEKTKLKYMTDGMLLREAILDPHLKRYSIVILDEAHERTIHTDILFGVVKKAQKYRLENGQLPLKIIIMSATMDVDHFSQYFDQAAVLYLEGRQFPVQLYYACDVQTDYVFSALVTILQIHQEAPPKHDILVFLTGQEEIESMAKSIRDISKEDSIGNKGLLVCPLYAALPPAQQLRVFHPAPQGVRKVILATNIAETSVTIQGIRFVIDTGMVKAKSFSASSGLDLLKVERISKAQAWQRCGRAGRESAGSCYRLYTEPQFELFSSSTVPEILRCNMSSVVLQLLALGISDITAFDFMDKPPPEAILNALEHLYLLGGVQKSGNLQLTDVGRQLAAFPLEPRLSKVILTARDHQCLEEILTIVSILSVDSVIHTPHSKRDEAIAARKKFMSSDGDHMTLLNIHQAYRSVNGNKQWCHENFINMRNMKTACEVRTQLREICVRLKLPIKSCGHDTTSIRRCLATGFFLQAAELQKEGEYITISSRKRVSIHPSSSLFMCKPACIIYNEVVQTTKTYMRDVCVVDPEWLYDAAPSYFRRRRISS